MRKSSLVLISTLAAALAAPLVAGGFYLNLRDPEATAETRDLRALVAIAVSGCHDPAAAKVSATAFKLVDGSRRSVPLTLTPLRAPGAYALTRQWPAEEGWVIQVIASEDGLKTSLLVPSTATGVDRTRARWQLSDPAPEQLDAMLRNR